MNIEQTNARYGFAARDLRRWKHMKHILKWSPWFQVLAGWMLFILGYGSLCVTAGLLDRFKLLHGPATDQVCLVFAALVILGSLLLIGLGTWRACTGSNHLGVKIIGVVLSLVLFAVQLLVVAYLSVVVGTFIGLTCAGHGM